MKRFVLLVLVMMALPGVETAEGATGNELHELCETKSPFCDGYIAGFLTGLQFRGTMREPKQDLNRIGICQPDSTLPQW